MPLYSDCLKTYALRLVLCNGNGLSGRQRVAWTLESVVDDVSCLCLVMLVQVVKVYNMVYCTIIYTTILLYNCFMYAMIIHPMPICVVSLK